MHEKLQHNTSKDENAELEKEVQCIKNDFGGNTGCLVVTLLDEGRCKLWKVLALEILSKLPMKFIKMARWQDVNKTMKVAFYSSITKVLKKKKKKNLSSVKTATFEDRHRYLQPHVSWVSTFSPVKTEETFAKETSYPRHNLLTMWSYLCSFMFKFYKVMQTCCNWVNLF